ncbi:hypothetical protein E4U54_002553 [Claviceps lovelessii]|nr:hypothetical protein E4U54_002553 [Claviceps lovelessii]
MGTCGVALKSWDVEVENGGAAEIMPLLNQSLGYFWQRKMFWMTIRVRDTPGRCISRLRSLGH